MTQKKMWKEVAVAQLQAPLWNMPVGTEESHENFSQNSQSLAQDSNHESRIYEAGVLTTCIRPCHSSGG